jgi:hypothetical protein
MAWVTYDIKKVCTFNIDFAGLKDRIYNYSSAKPTNILSN